MGDLRAAGPAKDTLGLGAVHCRVKRRVALVNAQVDIVERGSTGR